MSNCLVAPLDPTHEIYAGWDDQMNTHFACVIDLTKHEDDLTRYILWIGTKPNEVHDIAIIAHELRPYAMFDKNGLVVEQYLDDREGANK